MQREIEREAMKTEKAYRTYQDVFPFANTQRERERVV